METTRTIIAQNTATPEGDVAFLRICASEQPDGTIAVTSQYNGFQRNEVFMHREHGEGQLPDRDSYGVYTCVENTHQNKDRVPWKVYAIGNDLREVILLPKEVTSLSSLSDWLGTPFTGRFHKVFGGISEVYLFNQALGLIGPVGINNSTYFVPLPITKHFANVAPIILSGGIAFVLTEHLPVGERIQISKVDAARTLIHLLWKRHTLSWLSRNNHKELASAVLEFHDLPGIAWVKDDLRKALESLDSIDAIKAEVCQILLHDPKVQSEIETSWRALHSSEQAELDKVINANATLQGELRQDTANLEQIRAEVNQKKSESQQLSDEISRTREEAKRAFDNEIQKLAANPAHLAVLKGFLGTGGDQPKKSPFFTISVSADAPCESLQKALKENLHYCGLKTECAQEISCIVAAAIISGQPVSLLGNNADYLADAMAVALTNSGYVALDTPAGLLHPLSWPEELLRGHAAPVVIRSINRSAIDIVLGRLKEAILAQANQVQPAQLAVFMTLLPFDRFSVPQLPFLGPIIDERFLEFSPRTPTKPRAYAPTVGAEAGCIEAKELLDAFKELSGQIDDQFGGLSLRHLCTALGTLANVGLSGQQSQQALVKYWLLPRFDLANSSAGLKRYQTWTSKDPKLKTYYDRYEGNANPPGE